MDADVQVRVRRMFVAIMVAFVVVIGWQATMHLGAYGPYGAFLRQQNPWRQRVARMEARTPRGAILDHHGAKLAWTENHVRHYADPTTTSSVLGYLTARYGGTVVEDQWDSELAGLSVGTMAEYRRITEARQPHGRDVVLTLDLRLQQAATAALGARKGAVVALDPSTGAVRAIATWPTFNAETLEDDFATLNADTVNKPLRNRATQEFYPPGSTMKVVTAAAALMHGVDADTTYTCAGRGAVGGTRVVDYHGETHGTIAMSAALAHSCNFYFANTAARMGAEPYRETAEAFGFGAHWPAKLPEPRAFPLQLTPSTLTRTPDEAVAKGEMAHIGFGQSTVVATPLQMAMVAAAVANDGTLMAPMLVRELRDPATRESETFAPVSIGYPLTRDKAELLAGMMRGVVSGGTGRRAQTRDLTVAGKTGTAEQNGGDDHAWFIGFAERTRRGVPERLAFAVLIERGGTGGQVAVPVAKKLLEAWRDAE
jgi:peptidoglycan glycosyltransferase